LKFAHTARVAEKKPNLWNKLILLTLINTHVTQVELHTY